MAGVALSEEAAAEKMNAVVQSEASTTYLAFEGERAAGFVTGRRVSPFAGQETIGSIGYIDMIWVEPALRRLGWGVRLVGALEDSFRAEGISYVDLHYMAKGGRAEVFWRSCGYEAYRVSARKRLA